MTMPAHAGSTSPGPAATDRRRFQVFRKPILWLTLGYLLFELAFSARLLDVAGASTSMDAVHAIELYGRILSGIALALVFFPLVLNKEIWNWKGKAIACASIGVVCVAGMFKMQSMLIDGLVEDMGSTDRRNALFLSLAAESLIRGNLEIAELALGPEGIGSASGKAFVAVFPALALRLPDLEEHGRVVLAKLVRAKLTDRCENGQEQCVGTFSEFHNGTWHLVFGEVKKGYTEYKSGVDRYYDALANVGREQQKAWDTYTRDLYNSGKYRPETVPSYGWGRVRTKVRNQGLDVAPDWRPSDKAGFYRAVERKVRRDADAALERELNRQFGRRVPLDMSFDTFFRSETIQRRIRDKLNVGNSSLAFPPETVPSQVEARIYEPFVAHLVSRTLRELQAPVQEYGPGGSQEKRGREAAERVIVPPVALFFSLAGGLTHIFKLGVMLLSVAILVAPPRQWETGGLRLNRSLALRFAIMLAVADMMVTAPFQAASPVVESPAYRTFDRHLTERSPVLALGIEWIVRMQGYAYPVNEQVRRSVLGGFTFGIQT